MHTLQWGGRFTAAPDRRLLEFGSSLEEDLVLAPFDIACSLGHIEALLGGEIIGEADAALLARALHAISAEVIAGTFADYARSRAVEDVHGAIDARMRELAGTAGERLHAGRSRNDQVATTLLLYVRDRASAAGGRARDIAAHFAQRATAELDAMTVLAGCTHRQPAQPVLLAFMLVAWAQPFVRAAKRLACIEEEARAFCPLGSAALAGSSLPLDRARAAEALGFHAPSLNALDAVSSRDAALDLAHACVRAAIDASRIAEEIVTWCTPAYRYVRLSDAVSTGSSLMPQKRNPDPFELVRANAASLTGTYAAALGTLCGLAPSYQRDLQLTKALSIAIVERTLDVLEAFARTWDGVEFERGRMNASALDGFTLATDLADALIARGATARNAHALVGSAVARAESAGRGLDGSDLVWLAGEAGFVELVAPLDAIASVQSKRTVGSTSPQDVALQIDALNAELHALASARA